MKKIEKFCVCFLSFIIVLSYILVLPVNAAGEYSDYLDSVMNMVLERYYRDVTREKLLEGALKGIFGGLDDYTVFYDMEEAESFSRQWKVTIRGLALK